MNPSNPLTSKRQYYLDIARVIAIIAIMLNHTVSRSFSHFNHQMEEYLAIPLWLTVVKTVCAIFSNLGVPLFLMITGILILNKRMETTEDIKGFYKHNLLPLFITTEIWLILIYWYKGLFEGDASILQTQGLWGSVQGMIETMLFQNQVTFSSMWYMPMILCIYTTLPFVIIVKDKLSESKFSPILLLPALVLFLNSMVRPAVNVLLRMNGKHILTSELREADLFSYFYLYIFAGYLVGTGFLRKLKNWCVGLIFALSFVLCCGFQFYAYAQPLDYVVSYQFPLLPICAAFLLELLRRTAQSFRRLERPVTYLARISFGIYLIHMVVMTTLNSVMDYSGWNQAVKMLFMHAVTVAGSILIVAPLCKIKLFRKYLFLVK